MKKADEMPQGAEKKQMVMYGEVLELKLIDRREFYTGTFEKWEETSGMVFVCFIKSDNPIDSPRMVRVDLNRYEEPIQLGDNIYYFTEYWNNVIPKKYINTPIQFVPLQPLPANPISFNRGDLIVNKDYPTISYIVEETPGKCYTANGPAYALSSILPGGAKGPVYVYEKKIVEHNYVCLHRFMS